MPSTTATTQANGTNGHSTTTRPFNDGVYTPLITAMTEDEEVDLEAVKKQVVRLADAGMGIVLLGTNGEGEWTRLLSQDVFLFGSEKRGRWG
jgi:hypothetical protein